MSTFNIITSETSNLNNPDWDTKNKRSDINVQRIKHNSYTYDRTFLCRLGFCIEVNNSGFATTNSGYIGTSNNTIRKIGTYINDNYALLIRSQLLSKQMREGDFNFYNNQLSILKPRYKTTYLTDQHINHIFYTNQFSFKPQSLSLSLELSAYSTLSKNIHKQYTFIASNYYLSENENDHEDQLLNLANDIKNTYGGEILGVSAFTKSISLDLTASNSSTKQTLSSIMSDDRIGESIQNNLVSSTPVVTPMNLPLVGQNGTVMVPKGYTQWRIYDGSSGFIHTEGPVFLKADYSSLADATNWPVAMNPYWMDYEGADLTSVDTPGCVKTRKKTATEFIQTQLDNSKCWANPNFSNQTNQPYINGTTNSSITNLTNYLNTLEHPIQNFLKNNRHRTCALWSNEQSYVPWFLSRLNTTAIRSDGSTSMRHYTGRTKPRNTNCNSLKDPVHVYVVDQPVGDIARSHPEFENRFISSKGPLSASVPPSQFVNHGQFVASCVGSRNYGVSRKVSLVSIGVMDNYGYGDYITISKGIEEVIKDKINNPNRKIIINLSLGDAPTGPIQYLSQVTGIIITNSGTNYISEPTVYISNPSSNGYLPEIATAKASLYSFLSPYPGSIQKISVIQGGSGFTEPPTVTIFGGKGSNPMIEFTINNEGKFVATNIKNGGSNYISPPNIVVQDSFGQGAQFSCIISNGSISSISIINGGSGYTLNAQISVVGGKGVDATAVALTGLVPQMNILERTIIKAVKDYNIPVVIAAGNTNVPANSRSPARLGSYRPDWSPNSPFVSVIGATTIGPTFINEPPEHPLYTLTDLSYFDNWWYYIPGGIRTRVRQWGSYYKTRGWRGSFYDQKSSFSNYGDAVTAWAPGSDIDFANTRINKQNQTIHTYKTANGTSFAAPLAAGVLAEYLRVTNTNMPIGGNEAILAPGFITCQTSNCLAQQGLSRGRDMFVAISGIVGLDRNREQKTVNNIPIGGGFIDVPGPDRDIMIINRINHNVTQQTINNLDDTADCSSFSPNPTANFITQPKVYGNNLTVKARISV